MASAVRLLCFFLMVLCFGAARVMAAPLASFDTAGLHLELSSEDRGAYRLAISAALDAKMKVPSPKLMVLESPSRFVIDMPGVVAQGTKTVRLRDPWLSAVRYSAFGNGTRFVCDFRLRTEPRYVWKTSPVDGSVLIRFSLDPADLDNPAFENPKPTPRPTPKPTEQPDIVEEPIIEYTRAPQPTPTTAPVTVPARTPVPTPVPTAIPTPRPTPEEPIRPEVPPPWETPTQVETAAPSSGKLTGLSFRLTGKTKVPSVVFSLKGLEEYSLNNVGEGTYELVLKGVQVENRSLLLPAMPPENFERFEMVVPRVAGGNIRVKIRVESGVSLIPFVSGDELWIKAWGEKER